MTLLGKIFRPWDLAQGGEESEEPQEVKDEITPSEIKKETRKSPPRSEKCGNGDRKPRNLRLDEFKGSSSSEMTPSPMSSSSLGPLSCFLFPQTLSELANLSRTELTAMGLLPPETPGAGSRAKRARPKRFHCPHCQVAFSNNGQLRGHVRIHTGERPFLCEEEGCGKSFTRNEELTRHRRIHSGVRPYPCGYCGKKFGRKDHLKKHTRTHQRLIYTSPALMTFPSTTPFAFPGPSDFGSLPGTLSYPPTSLYLHPHHHHHNQSAHF